jgi:hypothetical protein
MSYTRYMTYTLHYMSYTRYMTCNFHSMSYTRYMTYTFHYMSFKRYMTYTLHYMSYTRYMTCIFHYMSYTRYMPFLSLSLSFYATYIYIYMRITMVLCDMCLWFICMIDFMYDIQLSAFVFVAADGMWDRVAQEQAHYSYVIHQSIINKLHTIPIKYYKQILSRYL